jgi:hypothetical protein
MSAPGRPDVDGAALLARLPSGASAQSGRCSRLCEQFTEVLDPASGLIGHLATLTPQPGPVHRHPGHHRDARRTDQHPAAGLRAPRRPDLAHPEVARTPPVAPDKGQLNPEIACRIARNFGLDAMRSEPDNN